MPASPLIRWPIHVVPYHVGNVWFGGMLPLLATTIVASCGNIYAGLRYPIKPSQELASRRSFL
jgi:hypothetical protein